MDSQPRREQHAALTTFRRSQTQSIALGENTCTTCDRQSISITEIDITLGHGERKWTFARSNQLMVNKSTLTTRRLWNGLSRFSLLKPPTPVKNFIEWTKVNGIFNQILEIRSFTEEIRVTAPWKSVRKPKLSVQDLQIVISSRLPNPSITWNKSSNLIRKLYFVN